MKYKHNIWVKAALIVFFAAVLWVCRSGLNEPLFKRTVTFANPSFAVTSQTGTAVIEQSKRTITLLDNEQRVTTRLRGGSKSENGFYLAERVAFDGDSIYVADVTHEEGSSRVQRERVLRFSQSGEYIETVYDQIYAQGEEPLQLGTICAMHVKDSSVHLLLRQTHGLTLLRLTKEGNETIVTVSETENLLQADFDIDTSRILYTTREGHLVLREADGTFTREALGDGRSVVWAAALTAQNGQVVSTLADSSLTYLAQDGTETVLLTDAWIYSLTAQDHLLACVDGERLFLWQEGEETPFFASSEAEQALHFWLRTIFSYISMLALIVIAVLVLWRPLLALMRGSSANAKQAMALLLIVLATTCAVSACLIPFYQTHIDSESVAELKQSAEFLANVSAGGIGDKLTTINNLSDYDGEAYRAIRTFLDDYCDKCAQNGNYSYYVLYRFDDTQLWGVMDYENTTGTIYPYARLAESGYDSVVATGESLVETDSADVYGVWNYAVAAVHDTSGKTVGLLEIGQNRYSTQQAQNTLLSGLVQTTFAALMMLALIVTELTGLRTALSEKRQLRQSGKKETALSMVRPLIFLLFLADNMDASYIPQLSDQLYMQSNLAVSSSMASALPMSLQLLFIAGSAVAAGFLIEKTGLRRSMTMGFAVQAIGHALSGAAMLTGSYVLLLSAKALGGIGTGAVIVCCNALPSCTNKQEQRDKLFGVLNVGIMSGVVLGCAAGGYVGRYLGYPASYAVSVLLALTALGLTLGSIRKETAPPKKQKTKNTAGRKELLSFLCKPAVFAFLLFVMVPFMVMSYFKDYLFPLYADSLGMDASQIGTVLLLCGMLAITMGMALPEKVLGRLGTRRALIASMLLECAAMLLFALLPQYETAVLTLCILSVASSFGLAAQGVYYTDQAERSTIEQGKAMGIFSLSDNLSQTSGPLLLGALLPLGFRGTALTAGLAGLCLTAAFISFTHRRKEQKINTARSDRADTAGH